MGHTNERESRSLRSRYGGVLVSGFDFARVFEEFQDHLAPRLDTYEQAISLYVLRHTRLKGVEESVIGFKSARYELARGVGAKGAAIAEGTVCEKLRSLESKGCIRLLDTVRDGRRLRVCLPSEIPGVVVAEKVPEPPDLETIDFFVEDSKRLRLLAREQHRCFYCLRSLNRENYVIEHVVSRPKGDNSYRNLVAACRDCNNGKCDRDAEDWLRSLSQDAVLDSEGFKQRLTQLARLRHGELIPPETP